MCKKPSNFIALWCKKNDDHFVQNGQNVIMLASTVSVLITSHRESAVSSLSSMKNLPLLRTGGDKRYYSICEFFLFLSLSD